MNFNINTLRPLEGAGRRLFVETYGCQMNVGDTEIVVSLMQREGYVYTETIGEADVILINTCSIRDNAEQRIWGRLAEMKRYRRERPGLAVGSFDQLLAQPFGHTADDPHDEPRTFAPVAFHLGQPAPDALQIGRAHV